MSKSLSEAIVFEPAIFASAPLDKRDWRAFSNLCVYGERFHRLRVDGRPKRIKKFAFTSVCVYNRLRVDRASGFLVCSR